MEAIFGKLPRWRNRRKRRRLQRLDIRSRQEPGQVRRRVCGFRLASSRTHWFRWSPLFLNPHIAWYRKSNFGHGRTSLLFTSHLIAHTGNDLLRTMLLQSPRRYLKSSLPQGTSPTYPFDRKLEGTLLRLD